MKVDLSAMTESQLTGLIARAKLRKTELEEKTIAKVRKRIQAMIESEGLTLKEVLGDLRKSRRTAAIVAMGKSRKH